LSFPSASGISSNPYRDGRQSIRDEIEALLQAGTSDGRRLLATITPQRQLRVWPEPARPADTAISWYRLKRNGRLHRPNDSPLPAGVAALGVWAAFEDGIMPATANLDMLTVPGRFLTETADYQNGRTPAVFHYPRGRSSGPPRMSCRGTLIDELDNGRYRLCPGPLRLSRAVCDCWLFTGDFG
jgi:hypothetical protein